MEIEAKQRMMTSKKQDIKHVMISNGSFTRKTETFLSNLNHSSDETVGWYHATSLADPRGTPGTRGPLWVLNSLVSERKLSVMHSLRLSGESLCQNFLVHPRCTLGGSTKFQTCQCVQPPIRFHVADRILSESTLWPLRSMSRFHFHAVFWGENWA